MSGGVDGSSWRGNVRKGVGQMWSWSMLRALPSGCSGASWWCDDVMMWWCEAVMMWSCEAGMLSCHFTLRAHRSGSCVYYLCVTLSLSLSLSLTHTHTPSLPLPSYRWHRRHPSLRWDVTEAELNAYPQLQSAILYNASRFVRPGGSLVMAANTID